MANQSITDPGFEPQIVLTGQSFNQTLDTPSTNDDANAVTIGAFTSTVELSVGVGDNDGATTSDTNSTMFAAAVDLNDVPGTKSMRATFVEFTSSGWTLNFTDDDATQRRFIAAAISVVEEAVSTGATVANRFIHRRSSM